MQANRILDLGCGPGYSVMDFTEGEVEEINSVDHSALFINHLNEWAGKHKKNQVTAILDDIAGVSLPGNYFNAGFCRWVLMFIPTVDKVIQKVYDALQPGGVFALMEYGPFLDISIHPPSKVFDLIYEAVYNLIASWGGDPDIGIRLPKMLEHVGFKDLEVTSVSKADKPGSPLWEWIEATGKNHSNLVQQNLISSDELNSYYKLMQSYGKNHHAVFTAPTVQQIIAYK